MNKFIVCIFAGFSLLASPVFADTGTAECAKELLLAYFPEAFVSQTLKKYNVPESEWAGINQELAAKDKDIIGKVEEKAAKLDPNPLKDPQQRQAAVKIFRETLLEVFSGVMKDHKITDEKQIQAMLDDIQLQKAARFKMCMEKQREKQPQQPQQTKPAVEPQN